MNPVDGNRPVLVVCEDHPPTRELLCDQLEAEGFEAVPAADGRDALRLTGLKRPDVILLDVGLPDGSGLAVLDAIRSGVDIDPETPVIVVSGRGHDYDRLRGFEHGANDYLAKPEATLFPAW